MSLRFSFDAERGVSHVASGLGAAQLGAARDDLLRIVDSIPGVDAQKFVTSMEATVSDAATKAVKGWVIKGMIANVGLLLVGLWLSRRKG